MNEVITKVVTYRGREIPVSELKPNSNIRVLVRCSHGEREVRWNRRHQLCYQCSAEAGAYSTSKKGREITWGDKISEAKKGKKFSEEHRLALSKAHLGKPLSKEHIAAQNKNRKRGKDHHNWKNIPESRRKIRKYLSGAIGAKFKNRELYKTQSITSSLPYSLDELMDHLESQFWPGMSWNNYGAWHIDHIRPDSLFSYTSENDQGFLDSWSIKNLQPLWANLNALKGNKDIDYPRINVYMLCGQSGVGKTTLCGELHDYFYIIESDKYPNTLKMCEKIGTTSLDKPILVVLPIKISTTIKLLSDKYKIIPIFLIEDAGVVKARLANRGDKINNVDRRFNRIQHLNNIYGVFSGKYEEVKSYLLNVAKRTDMA